MQSAGPSGTTNAGTDPAPGDLAPLLGVAPLLPAADSLIDGVALGLLTALVIIGTVMPLAAARRWTPTRARLSGLLLVSAAVVVVLWLAGEALFYDVLAGLGAVAPLVLANGVVAGYTDAALRACSPPPFGTGSLALRSAALLVAVGALRDALGHAAPDTALAQHPSSALFLAALLLAGTTALRSKDGRRPPDPTAVPGP